MVGWKCLFPVFFFLPVLVKPFLMLTTPLHGDRRRLCSMGDPGRLRVISSGTAVHVALKQYSFH